MIAYIFQATLRFIVVVKKYRAKLGRHHVFHVRYDKVNTSSFEVMSYCALMCSAAGSGGLLYFCYASPCMDG